MKNLKKEDLELMSYSDIAEILLKDKKEMSTAQLFKNICEMLELSNKTYENKIGDFYTALTTDKRFILLDSGNWDLKENHPIKNIKIVDDFDDLDDIDSDDITGEETDDEDETNFDEAPEEDADDISDEYKDLVIVDEDELEAGE